MRGSRSTATIRVRPWEEYDLRAEGVSSMKGCWFVGVLLAVLVALVPAAVAGVNRPTDEVTGAVGQGVLLDDEQVHTVARVERWWGGGFWYVKKGEAAVTVFVTVDAKAKTAHNPLYYGVRAPSGKTWGRAVFGGRGPRLPSSADASAGPHAEGWLTFVVPEADVNSLALVYRMDGGFGSTLVVPLGTPTPSPTARVGQAVTLEREQVHTVARAETWPGAGFWKPKAGHVYVTVNVKVKALKATTIGGTYYSFRDRTGKFYHGSVLGNRTPTLAHKTSLAAGRTAQGWVTMMIPKARLAGLTMTYHMLGGDGPTLVVPLSALRA
jgi:hypothetical protein